MNCEHATCRCRTEPNVGTRGHAYCSDRCGEDVRHGHPGPCACGHPGCSSVERRRTPRS